MRLISRHADFSMDDSPSASYYMIVILLFFYFSQSAFSAGGALAQSALVILLLLGLHSWLSVLFISRRPTYFKVMSCFLILLALIWVVSDKEVRSPDLGIVSTSVLLKNSLMVCLMLFAGFRLSMAKAIPERQECAVCLIVMTTSVIQYIIVGAMDDGQPADRFTNNGAYCLVSALPFVATLLKKRRGLALFCFLVIMAGVIASGKRGAVVCLTVALGYYFFAYPDNSASKWERRFTAATLALLILLSIILEATQNPYLRDRIFRTWYGYSSGRDFIYARCLHVWIDSSDEITMLFGRGMSQTINVADNYAHSDWLELLIDSGLPGVVIYALFFISYLRFIRKIGPRIGGNLRFVMNLIMLLLFIESLFSMGFMAIFNCFDTLLLGVTSGMSLREASENKREDVSKFAF